MLRIFSGIFIVFLINIGETKYSTMTFVNLPSILSWSDKVFDEGVSFCNSINKFNNISLYELKEKLLNEEKITEVYNDFSTKLNQIQREKWNLMYSRRYNSETLMQMQLELSNFINFIENTRKNIFYIKIEGYEIENKPKFFVENLTQNVREVTNKLEQIHDLIFPSLIELTMGLTQLLAIDSQRNLHLDCDKCTSAQQFMFLVYVNLIITEMKGFVLLTYTNSMLQYFYKPHNYTAEIIFTKEKFDTRVKDYFTNINKIMYRVPREIHRCEIIKPKRDVNFLEFTGYHQVFLIDAGTLGTDEYHRPLYCNLNCQYINHTYIAKLADVKIYNCQTINKAEKVQICSSESNEYRKYHWWKSEKIIYGQYKKCPTEITLGSENKIERSQCFMCQCSKIDKHPNYKDGVKRISVTPQMSDFKNNMIVVGVRFTQFNNTIHLQIYQAKFSFNNTTENLPVWKDLDDFKSNTVRKLNSKTLVEGLGKLYLDDVMLPPKYAVTGVKFHNHEHIQKGFHLQVHGTPINLETGELNSDSGVWFVGGDFGFLPTGDYKRKPIEIEMEDPDDPTRCNDYNYDRQTNKYIQFHHSSILKDAGQTTVPYLDAQSVKTYPAFPLSGVGLFYRGKFGCGGYITPRIFTIDLSEYAKSLN